MIKILSIGSDRKLFETESAVRTRSILYGKKMGEVHQVVFSLKNHGFKDIVISPEVTLYPTNSSNRFMYVFDAISLGKKIIREKKFVRGESVVTCQDPFESGFVGWRISRYFKLPLHLQVHTDFLSPYFRTSILQSIRVVLARFLLPRASGVRVVSERIKESLINSNIHLKHNPQVLPIRINVSDIDSSVSHEKNNIFPQFDFVIFMASRLEKEKRIDGAIRAFSKAVSQFPKIGLVIAGSGSQDKKLKDLVSILGIQKSVIFLGWVDNVREYITSANIFLSTSEYEGYGMSVVEAGLLGTPVVTTAVGVAGEILVDNKNSYVCKVGDIMCITRSIFNLIMHNDKRHAFSMALREDVIGLIPSQDEYIESYVNGVLECLR
ncbi:MAG: glycosyltransferase [Minisyncoccota bacterium]